MKYIKTITIVLLLLLLSGCAMTDYEFSTTYFDSEYPYDSHRGHYHYYSGSMYSEYFSGPYYHGPPYYYGYPLSEPEED